MYSEEEIKALELLAMKESVLSQIVVWLKVKGLWEDCCKDVESLKHLAKK